MQKFNFPVYSKNQTGYYIKHITPNKCIVVTNDSIKTQDYTPMFEEQAPTTTIHWDDVISRLSTERPQSSGERSLTSIAKKLLTN